jgi:hypothetical protein
VRLLHVAVESLQIEFQLAEMFGLKLLNLQLDADEAIETAMEEQQVDGEVAAADLHDVLRADEAKVPAQFDEELHELLDEGTLKVRLRVVGRKLKELD